MATENINFRMVYTDVKTAYGYAFKSGSGFRWVFRFAPAPGEFAIYEKGVARTMSDAMTEIRSWIREYDFVEVK